MNLIGGNGQGFFQNLDDQTKTWLHECFENRPFCINFPGGAESNIATPSPLLKGWGLTESLIRERFAGGGTDEDGQGLDKWLEKLANQNSAPYSYIAELGAFKEEFPNAEIIWKSNIVSGTWEEARIALQNVMEVSGCSRCVMGNEVYSGGNFDFNFDAFLLKASSFILWIKENYPTMKIAIPFAPNIQRGEHQRWNDALIEFIALNPNLVDAVDVHIYLTDEDLPAAFASYPIQKIVVEKDMDNPQLENCFDSFAWEYSNSNKWEDTISYIREVLPDTEIWMTEFNIKPSLNFGNTLANAAFIFRTFMEFSDRVAVMCVHNLVAPDVYGCISRADKLDYNVTGNNVKRTGYYALKLASQALGYRLPVVQLEDEITITKNSVLWIDNVTDFNPVSYIYPIGGKKIKGGVLNTLTGLNLYDSFGKVGYMSKTTTPFESNIIPIDSFLNSSSEQINITEFGFYYVELEDVEPKCRKRWFQFWLPNCGKPRVTTKNVNLSL